MSAMSDFLEAELLDHVLNNDAYASPNPIYIALFTTAVNDDDSGTEVSGNAYARVAADSGTVNKWNVSSPAGQATNNVAFTFPQASGGNWGTITHMAIYDAAVAGNLLLHGPLITPRVINDGDTFEFASGNLVVTFD